LRFASDMEEAGWLDESEEVDWLAEGTEEAGWLEEGEEEAASQEDADVVVESDVCRNRSSVMSNAGNENEGSWSRAASVSPGCGC
jgi:hypothetical protein